MMGKRSFIGVEAEGPRRGTPTLYLENDPTLTKESILGFLEGTSINHIYFGAGKGYGIPNNLVCLVPKLLKEGKEVTIEVNKSAQLDTLITIEGWSIFENSNIHIVYTVSVPSIRFIDNVYAEVKIDGEDGCIVYEVEGEPILTWADDALYFFDKEIEL